MSVIEQPRNVTAPPQLRDPEVCHYATPSNDDRALCGIDITGHAWCDCPGGRCLKRQECVVCADLHRCRA